MQGVGITFDGRGSSDADKDSLTFAWDLGDGSQTTGALVTHAYASEGSYTIKLVVRDPRAAADTASLTIRINPPGPVPPENHPPVASIIAPSEG
ncbi:MAG TPA: PKD domain-containing protein, partial [Gemmatimonadales bacterium]|nr:PKD domain-containing protein [Gemmatimonadales bacterium]